MSAYETQSETANSRQPWSNVYVPAVENAAVKLLADGAPLKRARSVACEWLERVGLGDRLEHTADRPGSYRLEAHLQVREHPRTWILSNPISAG